MESVPDPATSPPPRSEVGVAAVAVKKPAWNIPTALNGPIETGKPVIDESSWPALSESAKAPFKVSDGSAIGSTPASSASSSSKLQFTNPNPNPNSSNPNSPSRSKPSKRVITIPIVPSNSSSSPTPNPNLENDKFVLENPEQNSHANRQPNIRSRGGYNGNNPNNRRGGNINNNTGSRGGHNNNNNNNINNNNRGQGQYRNMNGPPVIPQHGYNVPPVYVRPPPPPPLPVAAPFIGAPPAVPVRPPPPYGAPMVYPGEMPPSPVYYVPQPFGPPGGPVFFPPLDPQRAALLKQIDYYFSGDNLCKDTWLRSQMDEQGWVPISLIANFNKVKQITTNIPFILDTLRISILVEVQGDKIRRRNDWMNWILRPQKIEPDNLSSKLQNVSIEGSSKINEFSPENNLDNDPIIQKGDN